MSALRRDDWLSGILGRDAWQVTVGQGGPDATTRAAILETPSPAFLYAKLPATDTPGVAALGRLGFNVIDTSVTLERDSGSHAMGDVANVCRSARPSDRDAVAALAGASFSFSRLHLDPDVTRAEADRSRAEWAANFFAGSRGDHMIVAEADGGCAGFMQLLGPTDGTLVIDLIGVAETARRRGLARGMIGFAAARIGGVDRIRVGTQAANVPSLRLYEALGFRTIASSYVLHCHKR